MKLNTFEDGRILSDFENAFPEIQKSDALILDVRENGGGSSNNGFSMLAYLTEKDIEGGRWRARNYRPAFRSWGMVEGWYAGRIIGLKAESAA